MIRLALICVNLLALGFLIYMAATEWPRRTEQVFVVVALFTYVCGNLWFILHYARPGDDESLVSLYLERKALEEKKRIQDLKSATDSGSRNK